MKNELDEQELRRLFSEIEAPAGLDRWRDRIADVHVNHAAPGADGDGVVTALRPRTRMRRSVATAAAVAAVVGLGGVVVTSTLLANMAPTDPTMIIDGPGPPLPSAPEPGPAWGPMTGDPAAANTGVPPGTPLADHEGTLRITTPGQVVTGLRVTGTVVVEAPNVTLWRVVVVAPATTAAVRQLADDLTVVDSVLTGGESLTQHANGLVVRRSRLESGVALMSGAELHDSHLAAADVVLAANTAGVLLRHNVMGRVTSAEGPVRDVTIENSVLSRVEAPGSASIHVRDNRFRGGPPSVGWNPGGAGHEWSGNTFLGTGAPAGP